MFSFLRQKLSPGFLQFLLNLAISLLCGLAFFLLFYGRYPLYFTNVNWIYTSGGDAFQHQIGWEWFRQEPWHFPIGLIESYGYPLGTTLSFTDSIPLLAIPFKLLSPLLNENFQYLGIWVLASITGQMLIGMLILGEFTTSYFKKILGASLLVLSPPLITWTFIHDSLTAQWILLMAIWFILLEYRHKLWRGAWIVLFAVAMLVHPYFVAMLIPLWAISLFFRYKMGKYKWGLTIDVYSFVGEILLIGYCIGLFSLDAKYFPGGGFGNFSWNLNGFINPFQFSAFLKSMPTGTSEQFVGFSYLGLGNLLILPIALILFLKKDRPLRHLFVILPFIFVSVLLSLFALSNRAFLNAQSLWDIQLPARILVVCSLFRASGRFIWPVFYLIVLFGLISTIRNFRYATLLLLLALLVQLIDLTPLYSSKKFNEFEDYQSNLKAKFWQAAVTTNEHIVLIPVNISQFNYEPIALYARQNQMTLNTGYFARANSGAMEEYADQVWEDLKLNRADNQTIYIFWDSKWEELAKEYLSGHMLICQVDGYYIALSVNNTLTQTNFDLAHSCSFP
jgi:hypothetical protein